MTHLGPSLRRAKVRERPGRRAAFAVVASLLLNLAIFAFLVRAGAFQMAAPTDVKRVSLAPVSADRWAANRAIAGAQPERKAATPFAMPRPPPPPPAPPPDDKREEKGRVVDLGPTNDKKPKDSHFLSDHDSSVEKETRSRHAKAGYERALPTPSAPGAPASAAPGQAGKADRTAPGLEGAPGEKRTDEQKVATLTPQPSPAEKGDLAAPRASREGVAPQPSPGEGGEGGQRRAGAPNENPLITPGTLARIAGGPAPDYLPDVEEGEGTFLNARQWKYATYFNRIKQAVSATWDPRTPLVARDPDGKMFGRSDRSTLVDVTLDGTGHLKSIVIAHTSGLDFLDRAAVTAFQRAEPFMNPPHGIVDERGEIRFAFGFVLEFGHPGMRIYRAPLPGE